MADKHHSGRKVKKMQKELYKEQREALCMTPSTEPPDLDKVAMYKVDELDAVAEKTIRQNGAIEAQMSALDKNSKKTKGYEEDDANNEAFIDYGKQKKKENEVE